MCFSNKSSLIIFQRLWAAGNGINAPAKPMNLLTTSMATMMAISREITSARLRLLLGGKVHCSAPTVGRVLLVGAECALAMILCFYKMNPNDQWQWEDIGFRTGYIALAQLPLIFLLAGKNNIIGFLVGSSYERLSWLHRWTARSLFLTVTIHMSFWFRGWARYEYISHKVATDPITQRGLAAWCILLWIVLSSGAPIRRWSYEIFVLQHVVVVAGFAAAVYLHIPDDLRVWVWIPIGFAISDRVGRFLSVCYINLAWFHGKTDESGFWACRASFEPVGSEMTRIIIKNPPIKWSPGQHVLLSCHSIAPLQSHPFTIASIPQDGRMEFLVKSKSGGTKRYFSHATKRGKLPLVKDDMNKAQITPIAIEGPYGGLRPLRQFDSVVLIAGGIGSTFTMPLLRDLVRSWKMGSQKKVKPRIFTTPVGAATRAIRFVWVVKSRQQLEWFAAQLTSTTEEVEQLKSEGHEVRLDISVYVSCDEVLNAQGGISSQKSPTFSLRSETTEGAPLSQSPDVNEKVNGNNRLTVIESGEEQPRNLSCKPRGACCCFRGVDEENQVFDLKEECLCNKGNEKNWPHQEDDIESFSSSGNSPLSVVSEKARGRSIHPAITIITGRPCPGAIIQRTLEQARGESAVVVCGPPGLVDDVRHSVVVLSDERAVHKGTGAQGIYLRTENFAY